MGVRDQLPGGARGVFDTATGAASQVIQGKPFDMVLLSTARAKLPGGDNARNTFDTMVALTHAKNVQQAGIKTQSRSFLRTTRRTSEVLPRDARDRRGGPQGAAGDLLRRAP